MKHPFVSLRRLRSRPFSRLWRGFFFLFFVWFYAVLFVPAALSKEIPGYYRDSPVFFEMFYEDYADSANLDLLPNNKLHLGEFGTKDLGGFTWEAKRVRNLSWWVNAEKMLYLLPLIASSDENHNKVAEEWFMKWARHHKMFRWPNRAAWNAMAAAIRSMVLVYFLKTEEIRDPQQTVLFRLLKEKLLNHQTFLSKGRNFDANSNHGMWEAIALLELTRVFPNARYKELALTRLLSLVERSVSAKGIHKEHAFAYHFGCLNVLAQCTDYLKSVSDLSWDGLAQLSDIEKRMLKACYFMQDHHGNVPTIGDSDEKRVTEQFRMQEGGNEENMCFDKEAGFAIFKDGDESNSRRYVVFNIQNEEPQFPFHFHNDVLAVYFNYDGEVILGDQGRYSYLPSLERRYFLSPAAHNMIVPPGQLSPVYKRAAGRIPVELLLAEKPRFEISPEGIIFGGDITYPYLSSDTARTGSGETAVKAPGKAHIMRRITIPREEPVLIVKDLIHGGCPVVLLWNLGHDIDSIEPPVPESSADGQSHEWFLVTKKNRKFLLSIEVGGSIDQTEWSLEIIKGATKPMLGWYSPGYQKKIAIPVIKLSLDAPHGIYVMTRLKKI